MSVWVIAGIVILIAALVAFRSSPFTSAGRKRSYVPDRYDLNELFTRLGLTPEEIQDLATPQWREVQIPKRSGGVRRLEIPDPKTLAMQRRILKRVLAKLKCHAAALGFEPSCSIVDAAAPHVGKRVVIRIDIRNFFESTSEETVGKWFRSIGWDADATKFLLTMVTYNGHLPQGAATSPRLSNLVNSRLDAGLERVAEHFRGHYTRYADDITLSFNTRNSTKVRGIIQIVRRILKRAGYEMQGKKTRILRSHQRQSVLGLTVNQKVGIPRSTRRRLRAARHRLAKTGEATYTAAQLKGWESFEKMVKDQV